MRECVGMYPYFEVVAEDAEIFAEVEAGAKLGDSSLALQELLDRRGIEEPRSKSVFSHASSAEGEKLKQAGGAEEVEIGGVEAGMDINVGSRLARARPAIFYAGEAVAIEVDGTLGAGAALQEPGVENGDDEKECNGKEEPPR
jgi:hypothetical protein